MLLWKKEITLKTKLPNYLIPAALGLGVYSASNRIEYRKHYNNNNNNTVSEE
jgi:hypothetical protein